MGAIAKARRYARERGMGAKRAAAYVGGAIEHAYGNRRKPRVDRHGKRVPILPASYKAKTHAQALARARARRG